MSAFRPQRGDEVDAWLKRWRDNCTYEFEHGTRNRIDQMIDDYRLHADTGTPLDAEVQDFPGRQS